MSKEIHKKVETAKEQGVTVYYNTDDMQIPHSGSGWYYAIKDITIRGPFPSEEGCWQAALCAACIVEPPGQAIYAAKVFERALHTGRLKSSGLYARLAVKLRQEVREINSRQYQIWGTWERVLSSEQPVCEIITAQNYYQQKQLRTLKRRDDAITRAQSYQAHYYY